MAISVFTILSFLRQAGFALAGAASLWGIYFAIRGQRADSDTHDVFSDVARRMVQPLTAGVLAAATAWFGLQGYRVVAPLARRAATVSTAVDVQTGWLRGLHEGITIVPRLTLEGTLAAMQSLHPVFVVFVGIFLAGLAYRYAYGDRFEDVMPWFYAAELVLAAALISIPVWRGGLNREQVFLIGHSVHSILTLGTVIILDFLLIITREAELYERVLYPVLPDVSKAVWVGLAIEFASVFVIYPDAVANTPKVLFMQTVIGVLVLNGVFLSGPMTEKLIASIKGGTVTALSRGWELAAGLSGAISLASWITVTFVDLLHGTGIAYTTFMAFYLAFIGAAFIGYEIVEHYKVGVRV